MPKIQDITKLEFPSKVEFDLNEIEAPLRRKFRRESTIPTWLLIVLALAIATIAYFLVGRVVDDQARAAENSRKYTNQELCVQYLNDTNLTDTSAQKTLETICK